MVNGKKTGQKEKVFITSSSAYVTVIHYEVKSGRYDFIIENRKITAMNKIIIEQADLQTDTPLKFTLTKPLASVMFDGVIVTDPAMAAQLRSAPEVLTRDVLLREQEQEAAARAETELAEAAAAQHIVAPPLNETSLALNHGFGRCARPWHGKSVSLHAELVCQRLHVKAI